VTFAHRHPNEPARFGLANGRGMRAIKGPERVNEEERGSLFPGLPVAIAAG